MKNYVWTKTASGWSLVRRAAIVDLPQPSLSNIFKPGTEELLPEVQRSISSGLNTIRAYLAENYPDVKVVHHELIGASVTTQYAPTSDIDTTVFVNLDRKDPRFGQIDEWIGDNIDGKMEFRGRPYQFKIAPESTIGQNENADAVYVPGSGFKKRVAPGVDVQNFEAIVDNPNSEERKMYLRMEPELQAIASQWSKEARAALSENDPEQFMPRLQSLAAKLVGKYKEIKDFRGASYRRGVDPGRISQNWNKENVIYKFLERDGYTKFLKMVKESIADGVLHPQELMTSISLAEAIAAGQIGFDARSDDPTAHVTFNTSDPTPSQRRRLRI